MQERVDQSVAERDAQHGGPSWYLTRGGEQYGPLTDRELSLFAEGGNFKDGDLLWTAGLDTWKPAQAIFSLGPAPESRAADSFEPDGEADAIFSLPPASEADAHNSVEPHGESVDALVQALSASTRPRKPTLKDRAVEEIKKFAAIFVYLWVVFTVFLIHQWVVLAENHISFRFYWLAAINALVLGKIMLIAEHFRFVERLRQRPLLYPIVYKAIAFTTLLFVAYILEEMLIGWIQGKGFLASVPPVGGGTITGAAALWLIFCIALVPFFAFKEFERAIGKTEFRMLLFGRR